MPVIRRNALHGSASVSACREYIENEEKTKGLVTGINCTTTFGDKEILLEQLAYHTDPDAGNRRSGYHVIQSFDANDPVDPGQVHEMGLELVRRAYPGHMAVVATHLNTDNLHNHILLSPIDHEGNRIIDRLGMSRSDCKGHEEKGVPCTGGLYALHAISDDIARENGCQIAGQMKISLYKGRGKYYGRLFEKEKPSRRMVIEKDISQALEIVNTEEELFKVLASKGYLLGNDWLIPPGFSRKMRFATARKLVNWPVFLARKTGPVMQCLELVKAAPEGVKGEPARFIYQKREQDIEAIVMASAGTEGAWLPEFFNARYKQISLVNEMSQSLEYLRDEAITTFNEIPGVIDRVDQETMENEKEYNRKKRELEKLEAQKKEDQKKDQERKDQKKARRLETAITRLKQDMNRLFAKMAVAARIARALQDIFSRKLFSRQHILSFHVSKAEIIPDHFREDPETVRLKAGSRMVALSSAQVKRDAEGVVCYVANDKDYAGLSGSRLKDVFNDIWQKRLEKEGREIDTRELER